MFTTETSRLKSIDEQYNRYLDVIPEAKLNRCMHSPFRKDEHPSFAIYVSKDKTQIKWRDYAEDIGGDLNDFLQRVNEFGIEYKPNSSKGAKVNGYNLCIYHVPQELRESDYKYFKDFGISKDTLNLYEVMASNTTISNNRILYKYKYDDPQFVYTWGLERNPNVKYYRPKAKSDAGKWKCQINDEYPFGWKQLPESDTCVIITKSAKDVMLLHELGYNAVAVNSETQFLNYPIYEQLLSRFSRVYLLLDNDTTGIKMTNKWCDLHMDLIPIQIPKGGQKDISDYYKAHGLDKTKTLLNNIILK